MRHPVKMKATEVTYEALGKQYVTYTELFDPLKILEIVRLITDTAHVSCTRQVKIEESIYKDNNLSHVEAWYTNIQSGFKHVLDSE